MGGGRGERMYGWERRVVTDICMYMYTAAEVDGSESCFVIQVCSASEVQLCHGGDAEAEFSLLP